MEKKSKNTILFIDNNSSFERAKEKIKLLRSYDEVLSSKIVEAEGFLEDYNIGTIILCCEDNDLKSFLFLKQLRENRKYDNLHIIILEKDCSNNFLIEMSDLDTDEIIHYQAQNWEFLTRIIKTLNRTSTDRLINIKDEILCEAGIINPKNGFFKGEYLNSVLSKETEYSDKNNIQSSVMAITPKNIAENEKNDFELILKNSLRSDDIIAETNEGYYCIFLHYTKLSQAYYLFEKLKKAFEPKWDIAVCIADINEENKLINETLKMGIEKAIRTNGSSIRVFSSNQTENEENSATPSEVENDKTEDYEIFHQTYKKKCKLVIEPTFKKLKNVIDSENVPNIFIDYSIGLKQSKFEIISNKSEFYLTINYNGITKIRIETVHILNNTMIDIEPVEFEIMEFSGKKLTDYIENVIKEIQL